MDNVEKLDFQALFRRLQHIAQPLLHSKKSRSVRGLLIMITALMFASSGISYYAAQKAGEVISKMQAQDINEWALAIGICLLLPVSLMAATVAFEFLRSKLAIDLFEWYATYLTRAWLLNPGVCARMATDDRIDNPEQVITQSLEDLLNILVGLSMAFVMYAFDTVMGMFQLYMNVPLLTLGALGWSLLGSGIVYLLARPLVALKRARQESDGDLRMALLAAREAATEALGQAQVGREEAKAIAALKPVIEARRRIMYTRRNVSLFAIPFNLWTAVLPPLMIAPFFFQQSPFYTPMAIGVVTTVGLAFVKAVTSMTMLVKEFDGITEGMSDIERVGTLMEAINEHIAAIQAEAKAAPLARK